MVRSAAALGGLLALLLIPSVVSAHAITDVQVDCDGQAIQVSGASFPDGVTVTVSGPQGYVETFAAEADVAWTVSLPLGPNGTYTIQWPAPGAVAVTFTVDCPGESQSPSQPPGSESPSPSEPPGSESPSPSEPPGSESPSPNPTPNRPTPSPTRTPGASPTPRHTLPPTDTVTPMSSVSRTDTVLATLLFIAVFAGAVGLRRAAEARTRRR